MILGGCGVRLDEMAGLYSSFANDGVYYPLQWTLPDSVWQQKKKQQAPNPLTGREILSPPATYMLTTILSELHRPDLPNLYEAAQGIPRIAWKTGTSYGRKDAWSIGYNKRYTVAVWMGNFNGQGVAELNGAGTATPLLFRLFNAIDRRATEDWVAAPQELASRLVCVHTGKVPDDFCTEQVMDMYIPGVSSGDVCDHMKDVYLSADERFSYCTSCLPANGYKVKSMLNLSPEIAAYYNTHHINYEHIPPHNPACTRMFEGQPPVITSLHQGLTYIITDKEQQLQLSCTASNDVQQVFWYVNDRFQGSSPAGGKIFFSPDKPAVRISCTDDKGRISNIEIKIKFI
jgi:penicillin-binding protein 1C